MRHCARTLVLVSAAALATLTTAGSAAAITLTATPDKGTYAVGETATLTVVLDLQGAPILDLYGRIEFDPGLLTGIDVTNSLGPPPPIPGGPDCGPGYCIVFNHILSTPLDVVATAVVTLFAEAPGFAEITWNPAPAGLPSGLATSFTIIPEPATAPLLGAGVVLLGLAARRRPPSRGGRR